MRLYALNHMYVQKILPFEEDPCNFLPEKTFLGSILLMQEFHELLSLSYLQKDLHYRNKTKPNQRSTKEIHVCLPSPLHSHAVRSGLLCVNGGRVWHCTSATRMSIAVLPGLESCFHVKRKIPFCLLFHNLQCIHCLAIFLQIMKIPLFVWQEQRFCHSKAKMHPATCPLILLCSTLRAHQLLIFRSDDTSSLDLLLVLSCCCYKEQHYNTKVIASTLKQFSQVI